ncbi:hypothetical protein L2E82_40528 [Cichorium intybus]|uniref:Uncharacterized protein n=1 Tax=Cichorium intybus TaxID=13427 RepID=A0ACB9AKK1_CICIN|nr:hypothetical protein L2E82_40528 [Cichorium intybus]
MGFLFRSSVAAVCLSRSFLTRKSSNLFCMLLKNLSLIMDLDLHSNNFSGDINSIFKKNVRDPLGHFNSIEAFRFAEGQIDGEKEREQIGEGTKSLSI